MLPPTWYKCEWASNGTLNYSTWGGNPVYHAGDGLYHLFVARVPGTLALWYNTSVVDHAVARSVTGPYARRATVLPAFAHNPQVVHQRYRNGTERVVVFYHGHPDGILRSDGSSPDGPFRPAAPANWSCDNPAPFWDAGEETWYVACRTARHGIRAAKSLAGPWAQVGAAPAEPPAGPGTWTEDPYLYRDGRGHWHALFHACNLDVYGDCGASPVSAHSFSRDLRTWRALPTYVQPYSATVLHEGGSRRTYATVERPKFYFDALGRPTHLFNGAANVASCLEVGLNKSCCDCKLLDHTMTLVRPLDV